MAIDGYIKVIAIDQKGLKSSARGYWSLMLLSNQYYFHPNDECREFYSCLRLPVLNSCLTEIAFEPKVTFRQTS